MGRVNRHIAEDSPLQEEEFEGKGSTIKGERQRLDDCS
jgi:hypothetical protein